MIRSYVFSEGKLVVQNLDLDALRVVRRDKGLITWIDLDRPTPEEAQQILEGMFAFHPLAIEDCLSLAELSKLEDYEEYIFMVMHAIGLSAEEKCITHELDLFLGKEFLVTHHIEPLPALQAVQDRISRGHVPLVRGPDRVTHLILDELMESYKPMMEEFSHKLEKLESAILQPKATTSVQQILAMRRNLFEIQRFTSPQREVIHRLTRGDNKLIRPHLVPYYRDLHDHLTRLEQITTTYSERLMLDFDVYINRTANEANEGIKVLTSLTAITLPPTIIGTWYGMNFVIFPELHYHYAYPLVALLTFLSMAVMWIWLKRKRWF